MKSFKDFQAVEEIIEQDDNTLLPEGFVYSEEPLLEGKSVHQSDLPAVLVMRRTSVRMFPNGQKIALYKVDKLNKYVTVPFTDDSWVMSTMDKK